VKFLSRFRTASEVPEASSRYGPNGRQVEALLKWLRSLSQEQVTLLAGLYGATHGLLAPSGTSAQEVIAREQAENDAEIFGWGMKNITKLPIAAIDRADRPAPVAIRAAAEAVLAAIDRSGRTPPEDVRKWAPMGGADLALLLVARPEATPANFDWLWNHYAQDLPELARIAGTSAGASRFGGPPPVEHPVHAAATQPTPALSLAPEPYRDPIGRQIDELAARHAEPAAKLRALYEQAREFSLDTNVWLAGDAIWTVVRDAWPAEEADPFFAARDDAETLLKEGDAELRRAVEAVVRDVADLAGTAIRSSAMIGSSHLNWDEQNRADDHAMHQAAGAHAVVEAAVLGSVLGDQLEEAATARLLLPWLALCEMSDDDRYGIIAAVEENTYDAIELLASDYVLLAEPDQPRSAMVRLLAPFATGEADEDTDEAMDGDNALDAFSDDELFGKGGIFNRGGGPTR
jgi:hypothetical protein